MGRNTLTVYIDRFLHGRHERKVLGSVLLVLAFLVVMIVYWQLRYVGITMTNETYCGYEEHVHTEECYEYVLTCGYEEGATENPEITHVHTDECYLKEAVLICGMDESEGHTHDESCYDEDGNLVCGMEESAGHVHDESCYETQLVLICGQEEAAVHVHTDECYGLMLTCGYEEHTHSVQCMIDESADLEDATVWEATLPSLSGNLRTDIVNIAYSQLGYSESTANYIFADDGATHLGYTRYGAWYGNAYGDWDSMFVAFCLDYAGIEDGFKYNSGAYAWTIDLANSGYYQASDVYSPSAGDVVFIDTDSDGKANVSAIVVSADEETQTITVIQGNYSVTDADGDTVDTVSLVNYVAGDPAIVGYANVLPVEAVDDEDENDEIEISEALTTLSYESDDYAITVSYGEDAALPEGTELSAYEYAQDSETYLARYKEAAELYGWEDSDDETNPYHGFRLFNIGLYYEGEEVEPATEVIVTVTYTGESGETTTSVSVTHFSDTETETLDATLDQSSDSQSVTFTSDTFSDFGIALASEEEETNALTASSSYELVEVTITDDVIENLDGLSYIITDRTTTYAMKAEEYDSNGLTAEAASTSSTLWTFTTDSNGGYYISSDGNYLLMSYKNANNGNLSLTNDVSDASVFTLSTYTTNGVTYLDIATIVTYNSTEYTYHLNISTSTKFLGYVNAASVGANSRMLLYTVSSPYDDYDTVDGFDLTIYASDSQTSSVYSETVYDVWTDGDYYYIPVSYFENVLYTDTYPYSFDSSSTVTCPFMYAPNGSKLMGTMNGSNYPNVTSCYYAFYAKIGDDWYLKVTDTTGGTTPRADVYYCPTFEYYFYIGSVNSSSVTGSSTDHENYGEEIITDFAGYENYTLIPIKYFSGHIVESSLTATGTLTINGESCGYCTATDFQYKTRRWSADVATPVFVYYNDAWYLRVQDNSVGYTLPRIGIIGYTGNVGVYTTEDEFYLWIYDELTQVYSNATWISGTTYNVNPSITNVISYTDPDDGETYYYIPVSYFESELESYGYDSSDISSRSLLYAPNASNTLSTTSNITTCLFADYAEIDGELYVRVTDTTGSSPHRANVYFCPEYVYNIYVGTATSETNSVEEITIDDYIGLGERYVLIPVSHFDNFFDESSLDSESLTSVTDDFTGYELTLYESPFQYAANWSSTSASDAYYVSYEGSWYLLVQYNCTSYSIPLRNKIWYTAGISQGVVLNLTNGNGTYEFTHYGDYSMRYNVDLSDFADDDGNVTITLPSDSDLNSTFAVATSGTDSAYVDLGSESAYDYKLVGWFNVATGEYYDVSSGSQTVTINVDDYCNVFYADWIAETYDFVEDTGDSSIIETANTSSFITIQLFDFNELFNLYSTSLSQSSLSSETWTDSGSFYSEPLLANSTTALTAIGKSFIFFDTDAPSSNTVGKLELPSDRKLWSYWTGASVQTDNSIKNSAYTGLYDEDIISILYSTTGSTLGSYYVGDANYLFTYDSDTGFYEFDAAKNAAVYQQSDERFYVYDSPQYYGSSSGSDGTIFLPFNSYTSDSSTYTYNNGEINYWFGVKIELDFYLPNDTGIGGNQINGEDMIFEFKGDDDVWVFVDDELVLDLGGIHSALKGTIDFSTGEVTVVKADGTATETTSFSTISAGTHTLTFYYMERGASASNMKITLNTIPEWKYESSTVGTMTATKTWVDNNNIDDLRPSSVTVGLFERADSYSSYVAATANSLVYTYEDVTYILDDDGYSYSDEDDYVNAYVSEGYIYVRVDTVDLSESNSWSYIWTLLDSEKSEYYQILELSTFINYTTTVTHETLTYYETYWSIEGYDSLNGTVTYDTVAGTGSWTGTLEDGLEIVLTDGAQNGVEDSSGFPTTYSGYVIYVTDSGTVSTTQVDFSQKAESVSGSSSTYTYGVTEDVPGTAIWTVVLTGEYDSFTDEDSNVVYAPTFYLQASDGKYLSFQVANAINSDYKLVLVDEKNDAIKFSYNTLGELNTEKSPGLRIIIEDDGSYALVEGRSLSIDVANVKIYTPTTTTIGSAYTITNTILPSVTLEKIETGDESTKLTGVVFEMYQKDDNGVITGYYTFDDTENVVVWSDSSATMTSDSDGTITYKYLPDGTYYLSETSTIDGYNLLTEELWFTVSGGEVTEVSDSVFISIAQDDPNSLTIIVGNNPGVELPETGSIGLILPYLAGCLLIVIPLLIQKKRRIARR